jgi:hypothetical protein
MNYGYTTPDGVMYSMDYEIAFFEIDEQLVNRQLHDSEGQLFLHENEKVIEVFLSPFAFNDSWSRFVHPIFLSLGGDARIILTNQRVVALRIASPEQALTGISLYNLPVAIGKYISTKKKEVLQIREYVEIPHDKIIGIKTNIGDALIDAIFGIKTNIGEILIFDNLSPWELCLDKENCLKIVEYLKQSEFTRVCKGKGKRKWEIIYYKDPTPYTVLWKYQNIYEKRRLIINVAKDHIKKGKVKRAIKEYKKAIKLIPNDEYSKKQIEMLQEVSNSQ